MRLRVFVGRIRFNQFPSFVVDIVVALCRTINAISPMQTCVEPLRAVRCGHLIGQHEPHLVVIRAGVVLGGEITTLPTPIAPCTSQTVEHLLCTGFARHFCAFCRNRAPQELWHVLFTDFGHRARHASLAEVFLRNHVRGNLAPFRRNFTIVEFEHNGSIGIANFRRRRAEIDIRISVLSCFSENAFDLHRTWPLTHDRLRGLPIYFKALHHAPIP